MSERINIPFTNEHFVAFCEKMVGQPYWYGAVIYKCTESLRARKAKQYPARYASRRTEILHEEAFFSGRGLPPFFCQVCPVFSPCFSPLRAGVNLPI